MSIDINDLIHTQVTRPQVPIEDDGKGNYNISPIGFPVANRSGINNPTLFKPDFILGQIPTVVNTNVSPLSGLHSLTYKSNQLLELTNQTIPSENGFYYVRENDWDKLVEYQYDGTENDNKEGYYDSFDEEGNQTNHFRKGYSLQEVSKFIQDKLYPSLNFGKFKGVNSSDNGALYKWAFDSKKVNIGGGANNKTVYIDPFGLGGEGDKKRTSGPIDLTNPEDIQTLLDIKKQESKIARWSLSNHHTEAIHGRNKSPFVRDYPFKYNSIYNRKIFSGGMLPIDYELDEFRIDLPSAGAIDLRPFCDETLYYQRENGYHNNITIDMNNRKMNGKQHISILHHLDRSDAPNRGDYILDGEELELTSYTEYRSDLLMTELDKIANTTLSNGSKILYKKTVGNVTKYYYKNRLPESIESILPFPGTWDVDKLLWEDGGSDVLRIYITPGDYVNFSVNTKSIAWILDVLEKFNQLIPMPFTVPSDSVDEDQFIKDLDVLFIHNSLVDHTQTIHQKEKVRSKKTFVHLPTSVDLLDGQQFELDVSLPMISEQSAFPFNTLGSVTGYMNYVTQPRLYVFSGMQTCYGINSENQSIKHALKVNQLTGVGNTITITSNLHGIPPTSEILLRVMGANQTEYNGLHEATVIDGNSIEYTISNSVTTSPATGDISIHWITKISDIIITSLTQTDGVATLVTLNPHGLKVENILITISDAAYNGTFRAVVLDDNTIIFNVPSTSNPITNGAKITQIILANADNFHHDVLVDLPDVQSINRIGFDVFVTFTKKLNLNISTSSIYLTVQGCIQPEYNGEFIADIYYEDTIRYVIDTNTAVTPATGPYSVYGYMTASAHGIDSNAELSGEHVEGLTERRNPYLYSVMPEVEYATETNLYHQRKMELSDIQSKDKRVLLASIYPTSTNTFAWRMDNDPQLRLLKWSLVAHTSTVGSPAYEGYLANKSAYDKISPFLGSSRMSLYESSISYDNAKFNGNSEDFESFITSRIRVLMPELINPTTESQILTEEEAYTHGSLVYQSKLAYNSLIDTFHSTRLGVNNQINLEDDYLDSVLTYDDNGLHGSDLTLATGFHDGILQFNTTVSPNASTDNAERWLNKAVYTANLAVNAQGLTAIPDDDVYSGVSNVFKTYLEDNFGENPIDSNAGNRYVPGNLNSELDGKYPFGVGLNNPILNYLNNISAFQSIKNDFTLQLNDWYSEIPNTSGDVRNFSDRFKLTSKPISKASVANFYQMNMMPFSKIFSCDGIILSDAIIDDMEDYGDVLSDVNTNETFRNSIKSNPLLETYIDDGFSNAFVSLNTQHDNSNIKEYLRNHMAGYSNYMPIRFYNSFRIGIYGNGSSLANSDYEVTRIYNYSLRDYVNQYIEPLPNALYGKYIDDNYYLISKSLPSVWANDSNESHFHFDGIGVSAVGKIDIEDWTELLDGGNATIEINGYVFTATSSDTPNFNEFTAGIGDIETANSLVSQINNSIAPELEHITADNYGGDSSIITLTVSATQGSLGNSYTLVFTPSTPDDSGIVITPFSGGMDGNQDRMNRLVTVSGHQYMADKSFYETTMRYSYIRVKMRFIFSAKCGRWLTIDYRQTPTSYLTPSVGNEAFSYMEKSIVKKGHDGFSISDYLPVTESTVSSFTNKDYLWEINDCFDPNRAHEELSCVAYPNMSPMELNRFALPFLATEFPYNDNGKLKYDDYKDGPENPESPIQYRYDGLKNPTQYIRFLTPNNMHGGKIIKTQFGDVDTGNPEINMFQPHLWAFYWHMRPATAGMYGCDIPSPTSRTGGVYSDPTLHNMYQFPCRYNDVNSPCYLIPWHEDMNLDWLMNDRISIDAKVGDYPNRSNKMDIDAIMGNYDWETNSEIDPSEPLDKDREGYLIIESDRPTT